MFFNKKLFLIVPVVLFALACHKSNNLPNEQPGCEIPELECEHTEAAIGISAISGPTTATLGQPLVLTIMATGRNGCAVSAKAAGTPSTTSIALSATICYTGGMCTQALVELATTYTFTPTNAGSYTFHATDYEGNPIQHTVNVQ